MLHAASDSMVEVCDRWRNSFENFLADVGEAPSPDHIFTRVNKRVGFEPSNCKWATREEEREYRKTIEPLAAVRLGRLTLDTVIKHAPAFFLALPKEDRLEVLRLAFKLAPESTGAHYLLQHWPSWRCKSCRDELVAAIAWERLSRMKGEELRQLTISQALLDLSIERVQAERGETAQHTEAVLKRRAYEDYLFLTTGRASQEQFEQLWDSELREQYARLHAAKQTLRDVNTREQDKN
jgi:hypothetical protein